MNDIFVNSNDEDVKEELKNLKKEALASGGMFVSDLVEKINNDRKERSKEAKKPSQLLVSKN